MPQPSPPPHVASAFAEFERQAEAAVRLAVEAGEYKTSPTHEGTARAWLALQAEERANASSAKRDAREEETLSISKRSAATAEEALSTAKSANLIASEQLVAARRNARYAMYAAAVATTAAIVSAKAEIYEFIAKFL